jgi:pimeloyl-ACP methyl ester carboxylesterase
MYNIIMSKQTPILHYEISGQGKTVVLLHGFMASSRYWHRVVAMLSKRYRVVAIDLLGFGDSPKPGCSRYDYTAHIESIDATLTAIGIRQRFVLVGHSMGALIALRYARLHAERVSRLVLANMPIYLTKQQAKENILGQSLLYWFALRPGLHSVIWPIFKLASQLHLLPIKDIEAAGARSNYIFQSTGISRLRSLRNIIYAAKIETDLRALQVATTLVSGVHDRRAKYSSALPGLQLSKLVDIQNIAGGHHFPLRRPDLFLGLVATQS